MRPDGQREERAYREYSSPREDGLNAGLYGMQRGPNLQVYRTQDTSC